MSCPLSRCEHHYWYRIPDLYSDAHPEYEEPEEVAPVENEQEKETQTVTAPSTNVVDVIVHSMIAEPYIMKVILFAVVLGLIAWYIRRRSSDNTAFETEKSVT
jgi:Na+/H+-dicarboxylate symporter